METSLQYGERKILSDQDLAQWIYVFETMALASTNKKIPTMKEVPKVEGFSHIRTEFLELQKAFQLLGKEK
jgi:hypothetical protein